MYLSKLNPERTDIPPVIRNFHTAYKEARSSEFLAPDHSALRRYALTQQHMLEGLAEMALQLDRLERKEGSRLDCKG